MNLTSHRLALCIGVDPRRVHDIVQGKRSVTADTALRLGRFFGVSTEIWMDLQTRFDLDVAAATTA
jgi:antitoxin HigA-1